MKKTTFKCNHVYEETSLLPKSLYIDTLCPVCKKNLKKLQEYYDFEDKYSLEHFRYTSETIHKALTASQNRQRLLDGINTPYLQESGLYGYLEDLLGDTRQNAEELIARTRIIINADMNFWYSWRNKTCQDLIRYIEIGDIKY